MCVLLLWSRHDGTAMATRSRPAMPESPYDVPRRGLRAFFEASRTPTSSVVDGLGSSSRCGLAIAVSDRTRCCDTHRETRTRRMANGSTSKSRPMPMGRRRPKALRWTYLGPGSRVNRLSPGICGRPQLHRQRRRDRARPDLCARLVGAVGELDPPAILHAAQHPSVALRHRLPAPGARAAGCRSRAEGAWLSLPGEPGGRSGAARQPRDPEGRGLCGRAARSGGAARALSLDLRRRASRSPRTARPTRAGSTGRR